MDILELGRSNARETAQAFLMANESFLEGVGKSTAEQVREMRARGSNVSGVGIMLFKNGNGVGCPRLTWFSMFCEYWGKPFEHFLVEGRKILADRRAAGLDTYSGTGSRARRKKRVEVPKLK